MKFLLVLVLVFVGACKSEVQAGSENAGVFKLSHKPVEAEPAPAAKPLEVIYPDKDLPMDTHPVTEKDRQAFIKAAPRYLKRWRKEASEDTKALLQMGLFEFNIPASKLGISHSEVKRLQADYPYEDNRP